MATAVIAEPNAIIRPTYEFEASKRFAKYKFKYGMTKS